MKSVKPETSAKVTNGGFSLVEVIVATSMAVIVLGTASLLFQTVSVNQRRMSEFGPVTVGANEVANYYDGEAVGTTVDTYIAPHYGRSARAEILREKFWDDVRHANAVFCLARSGLNSIRPDFITIPTGFDMRDVDTPERFRSFLEAAIPSSTGVFQNSRGAPDYPNCTIFVLQPSEYSDSLTVRAVYEIDVQTITNGATTEGHYALVRRYAFGKRTHYYDVYYYAENGGAGSFQPVFASHERRERLAVAESSYDVFKTARDMPFYLIWWPDPGVPNLLGEGVANSTTLTSPLSVYGDMGGKTSFMFTVPVFPAL
ncbi:MAG: hypothetical protein AAGA58_17270 [Verrucomicrobiota bacterium]